MWKTSVWRWAVAMSKKPFCKLYETEQGQILVKLDAGKDEAPEVRFYAQPEGLGVCSHAVTYADSDAGWDRAEAQFAQIDQAKAMEVVRPIFAMADKLEVSDV